MFDSFMNTQAVSDRLKRLVISRPAKSGDQQRRKRAAMDALTRFEGTGWHYIAFADLFAKSGKFKLEADGRINYKHKPADAAFDSVWDDVAALVSEYVDLMTPPAMRLYPTADDTKPEPMLSLEQAAGYLKLTIDGVKHHVYRTGRLTGMIKDEKLYFPKTELDAFLRNPPKRGGDRRSEVARAKDRA